MRTPHSSYKKGTKLRIVLRNGYILEDTFIDKKSGALLLKSIPRISMKDIKTVGILKNRNPGHDKRAISRKTT